LYTIIKGVETDLKRRKCHWAGTSVRNFGWRTVQNTKHGKEFYICPCLE